MTSQTAYLLTFAMIVIEKIVCIILGYLTIRLGYQLMISGIKGEFKFSAKLSGVTTDLASVSPGLLFVLLGSLLIGFALFVDKKASTEEKSDAAGEVTAAPAPAPLPAASFPEEQK